MKHLTYITMLGDSILKGIQLNPETNRYQTKNEIGIPALEQAFGVTVKNDSHFGATVVRGGRRLDRLLNQTEPCDAVVMDFGGNDCDYAWGEIADHPAENHQPHVPLPAFTKAYRQVIRTLREKGILPILTTLPPLEPQWFFDWWCRNLDQDAVSQWLGSVSNIYAHQERYSQAVVCLALEEGVPLIDLRGAFLDHRPYEQLICADGTHPNSAGQAVIGQAFQSFGAQWKGA